MASTLELLRRLVAERVEFVLVGGMAAIAHGSSSVTEDVDVCIRFDEDDPLRFVGFANLYVATDAGVIGLLGALTGVGDFERVDRGAVTLQLGDLPVRVIGLDDLLLSKRAVARPKDLRVASELEFVRDRLKKAP